MKAVRFLVLYCGTNNIDNDKPIDIAEGILSIASYVHVRKPNIYNYRRLIAKRSIFNINTSKAKRKIH